MVVAEHLEARGLSAALESQHLVGTNQVAASPACGAGVGHADRFDDLRGGAVPSAAEQSAARFLGVGRGDMRVDRRKSLPA